MIDIALFGISKLFELLSSNENVDKLNLGDIIYVDRGLYKHFGVYSGENKVIYYTKDKNNELDGIIRETSLKTFLNNENKCFICNFDENGNRTSISQFNSQSCVPMIFDYELDKNMNRKLYSAEETVRRARNCIGNKGYNLVCNNCEHFAIWCKTGVSESGQVNSIIDLITQKHLFIMAVY